MTIDFSSVPDKRMAETVLFRDKPVHVKKSNSVTAWVYFVDDPEEFAFQVRTKQLVRVEV